MANIQHINPTAAVQGFRAQVTTVAPGLALIRGTASDQVTLAGAAATSILAVGDLDSAVLRANDVVNTRMAQPGEFAYVQAGAAIAVDAKLSTNASAQFITGTTGQKALAKALAPAAAAGDLIPVLFLDGDLTLP